MSAKIKLGILILVLGLSAFTNGAPVEPTRAFCRIVWLLGVPCSQANVAIVTQIKAMGSYKLGPVTPVLIQANHTSALGQVESVNFTILAASMSMGCRVDGVSTSAFWSSLFDNGTNYCNLRNVMQGSGLTKAPGFTEFTNEWLCLGFGTSACKP
ncbi:uncharacterized protein LOC144085286 [Stigmatopora argus]